MLQSENCLKSPYTCRFHVSVVVQTVILILEVERLAKNLGKMLWDPYPQIKFLLLNVSMMLSFSGLRLAVFFCRLLSWASNNQVSFWSLANKITCKKDIEDINRYLTRKNCKFMLIYCGECPACVLYMLSNKLLIELLQT